MPAPVPKQSRISCNSARKINERILVRSLTAWFRRNARELPWRRKRTGYTALVAELMLQQTQVSRVVDRYRAFLKRFPKLRTLARARERTVLKEWQGLGYYRRAQHLHQAAKAIVARHNGRVPRSVSQLRTLPGVGRYTAGAIASIVFGRREPIVDGNIERVLFRLYGCDSHMNQSELNTFAWGKAEHLVHIAKNPGEFNESLMELGSQICTPRSPQCRRCPVALMCMANRAGSFSRQPSKAITSRRHVTHHAVVISRPDENKVILEQRPDNGMWAGLWQLPTIEANRPLSLRSIRTHLTFPIQSLTRIGTFEHITTHRTIMFRVYRATSTSKQGRWFNSAQRRRLPMSNAHRRIFELYKQETISKSTRRRSRLAASA